MSGPCGARGERLEVVRCICLATNVTVAVDFEHLRTKCVEGPTEVARVDVAAVVTVVAPVRPADVHADEPKLVIPDGTS